jgi:hypothetical protein
MSTLNDGNFVLRPDGSMPVQPSVWSVGNLPAIYQHEASGLSFADGHSEIKKWKDRVLQLCTQRPPPSGNDNGGQGKSDAGLARRTSHHEMRMPPAFTSWNCLQAASTLKSMKRNTGRIVAHNHV